MYKNKNIYIEIAFIVFDNKICEFQDFIRICNCYCTLDASKIKFIKICNWG